jgi:glycerol-3-phosphate O-acyltransferase
LIARFFRYHNEVSLDDIINGCAEIYPIIKEEYTLPWDDEGIGQVAHSYLNTMVQLGLIVEKGSGIYQRPERSFDQFENLSLLGNLLGLAFERYTLTVSLLSKYSSTGYVNEKSLHEQCRQIARRMAILNGVNNPEFVEKSFYENQIKILKKKGLIKPADEGRLEIDGRLAALASSSKKLLSPDARYTIERIFSKH